MYNVTNLNNEESFSLKTNKLSKVIPVKSRDSLNILSSKLVTLRYHACREPSNKTAESTVIITKHTTMIGLLKCFTK